MFWNTIISTLSEAATVSSMTVLLLNSVAALLVSCIIFLSYRLTYSGTAFSKKFMVSLGMMTLVTTIIMNVISNNVALSLGMVGALSIIRFRTAVKDVPPTFSGALLWVWPAACPCMPRRWSARWCC